MRLRPIALATLALFLASPAIAQPANQAAVTALATIGTTTRDIVIRFVCRLERGRMSSLGIAIDVPEAESLTRTFDFGQLEGPSGTGGKNHLAVSGQAKSEMDFGINGSYGENGAPGSTFTMSAIYMRSDRQFAAKLRSLQSIVAALSTGPSHLTYTAANPARNGPALQASADLSDADAAQLRQATVGCVGGR